MTQASVAKHNRAAGKSKRKGKVWRKMANKLLAKGASEGVKSAPTRQTAIYQLKRAMLEVEYGISVVEILRIRT